MDPIKVDFSEKGKKKRNVNILIPPEKAGLKMAINIAVTLIVAAVESALESICESAWELNSIQYERQTGLIHREFVFQIEAR